MSRLEELIQEYCPDGVEYRKIGSFCDVFTGGEAPEDSIKSSEPDGEYIYPIYSNGIGNNAIWGYAKSYVIDSQAITFSSIGTIGHPEIRKPKFTPIIRLKTIIPDEEIAIIGYLKYCLEIVDFKSQKSSVPNINSKMIKDLEAPVPPLPVQREIVRILDSFTDYKAELEAELEARKKQYKEYRENMFAFYADSPREKLINVADINRGIRVVKKQLIENGPYPVYQNSLAPMGYYEKSNCPKNTTYVISAGAAGEIGFCNTDFWAADDCLVFSNLTKVRNKYIYHFLMTKQDYIRANVRKASIPRLSRTIIENLEIPIIPIEEQDKMIVLLDRFDFLCNDICSGLPAEIAARQKQYEYYRDKLLTFKSKA